MCKEGGWRNVERRACHVGKHRCKTATCQLQGAAAERVKLERLHLCCKAMIGLRIIGLTIIGYKTGINEMPRLYEVAVPEALHHHLVIFCGPEGYKSFILMHTTHMLHSHCAAEEC